MVDRICPPLPGGDRVKVSENLGATVVVQLTPVDTSLVLEATVPYVHMKDIKKIFHTAFVHKRHHNLEGGGVKFDRNLPMTSSKK